MKAVLVGVLAQTVTEDSKKKSVAQDGASKAEERADSLKKKRSDRLAYMQRAAAEYDIRWQSQPEEKLTLRKEPVLRYNDQVTNVPDGSLFVWTRKDRPEAIVCIWYHPKGMRFHEFQSLSRNKLTAMRRGRPRGNPSTPGIEFKPLSAAPVPGKSPRARLRQMRNLARGFSASVNGPKYGRQQLRFMPQPIFRYGKSDGDVLDGAKFEF